MALPPCRDAPRGAGSGLVVLCLLLPPRLPGKVLKHAQLIAIQIGGTELAQTPRFVLRLSKDLCPSLPPILEQFIQCCELLRRVAQLDMSLLAVLDSVTKGGQLCTLLCVATR